MKITGLKTFVVGNPPPTFGGRYFIFLKLVTGDGIEGLGEVYAATFGPQTIVTHDRGRVRSIMWTDADPFPIETLWRNVYGARLLARPDLSLMGVLSGHRDGLLGHRRQGGGKPVTSCSAGKCMSGCAPTRISIRAAEGDAMRPGVYRDPDVAAERAAEYLAQGFTALKFDPAGPIATFDPRQPSLERARALARILPQAARGGRQKMRPAVRHPRPVHRLRRDSAGAPHRTL